MYISKSYIYRCLHHFTKLVDAYHIFNSTNITPELFEKGEALLDAFVDEFEDLYGEINMVFNIHMLQHIPECVRKNGPLCCYSNYNMEDNIGNLVSRIHGTTDVVIQCTHKYILDKELNKKLEKSDIAQKFNEKIENHRYGNSPLQSSNLTRSEIEFIQNTLQKAPIEEFRSLWIGKDFYRSEEGVEMSRKRKTYDSFVVTNDGILGTIRSIFKTFCKSTYILLREDYCLKNVHPCESIKSLGLISRPAIHVINTNKIKKAVLIKFGNTLVYSTFPNKIERD